MARPLWRPIADKAKLAVLWPNHPRADILAAFPGRTWEAIRQKAAKWKIRRNFRRDQCRIRPSDSLMAELRAARIAMGLSATALSRRLGYGSGSVHSWERGATTPSYFALRCWCEALSVSLAAKPAPPMRGSRKGGLDGQEDEDRRCCAI